jgi:transposase-like protein
MLRNWRNRGGGRNAGPALHPIPASAARSAPDPAAEIYRLRRENDRRRMERDILKKLWPSSRNRRDEVPPDRGPPGRLAGARHVRCAERAAAGCYAWRSRPESRRKSVNRGRLGAIQRVQARHRERYGAPRIHAELRAAGQTVSRKRVERVMR